MTITSHSRPEDEDSTTRGRTPFQWHIVESTDRWYQAYQQSVVSMSLPYNKTVTRWNDQSIADLPASLKLSGGQGQADPTWICLLWELPLGNVPTSRLLDLLASVSQHRPRSIQLAHFPTTIHAATALAIQEAGVSIVLPDLWVLGRVIKRIESFAGTK
jgi:hypothetical protein